MSEQMNNFETNNNSAAPTNGLAIASLVLGIASILLNCWSKGTLIALIAGIVGIVLSVMAKKKIGPSGMGKAGLICSIIGIVFAVIIFILAIVAASLLLSLGLAL